MEVHLLQAFTVGADGGERLRFSGAEVVLKVSGDATDGALAVIEEIDPLDTPLHIHTNEDELWCVIEGEHIFQVGDKEFNAGPGDMVFGPRGIPHAQRRVVPRSGRVLVFISPAGFEGFFQDLAEAESSGSSMPDVYQRVSEKFGITWVSGS